MLNITPLNDQVLVVLDSPETASQYIPDVALDSQATGVVEATAMGMMSDAQPGDRVVFWKHSPQAQVIAGDSVLALIEEQSLLAIISKIDDDMPGDFVDPDWSENL